MRSSPSADKRVWLFDLDNTLHDAGAFVFRELNQSMTAYVQRELQLSWAQADQLRQDYWHRYGATLIGLVRHHGVDAAHFLHDTHRLPGLEERVTASLRDVAAIKQLGGRRVVLTNAPRHYALRVLRALGIAHLFDVVVGMEQMRMFGQLRPKPDRRMFKRLLAQLKANASDCVLVEDTLIHQKAAHGLGIKTAWACRYARTKSQMGKVSVYQPAKPRYVYARIGTLQSLRRIF